ncbi:MAG: SPASM domain-containing protein [Alphaproteobacteria bacterium]|nr:SPASM domain-containing protein [Alphaproteobacteria bacterium]
MNVSLDHFGVLQIEPTDRCNLSCRMCTPHFEGQAQIHGVPKGIMDLDLYRHIIDGLVADDARFDHLIFQWLGDPSLHPGLEDMVAYAQRRLTGRVGYLRIDTNAIKLNPARMDRLVQVYTQAPELPLLLVFTVDAHTPETYHHVKGQDALHRVRRNIRRFLSRRARLRGDVRLNVQLQFVVQPGNAHELGDFIGYWSDALACYGGGKGYSEIMVKRLSVAAGGEGQREADLLYERTVDALGVTDEDWGHVHIRVWSERPWASTLEAPGPRPPCAGLWATPVIRHDGHLMMCCADLPGELDLGDLATQGFRALWEGAEAERRRLAHIRGAFDEVGPCAACGGINWYHVPPEVVRGTLARAGAAALWPDYARRMLSGG